MPTTEVLQENQNSASFGELVSVCYGTAVDLRNRVRSLFQGLPQNRSVLATRPSGRWDQCRGLTGLCSAALAPSSPLSLGPKHSFLLHLSFPPKQNITFSMRLLVLLPLPWVCMRFWVVALLTPLPSMGCPVLVLS